jgi:transposase
MRFVPLKTTGQQDVQALHRIRAQLIKWRTGLANEIRGLLGEYGVVLRKGMAPLRRALASIVEDERELLSSFFREMLSEMGERLRFLDERLREYDRRVEAVFSQDERCRRLAQVEGVGALAATALVAAVGNAREFRTGRELSAWLGLVPRQHSTGGRTVLLGITKRGDRYLRMLLIHGARAALRWVERRRDAPGVALTRLKTRRGPNVAAVALANRNARVLWALLTRGEDYRPRAHRRLVCAQAS